jgi:hypothetical protein
MAMKPRKMMKKGGLTGKYSRSRGFWSSGGGGSGNTSREDICGAFYLFIPKTNGASKASLCN